MAGTDIDPTSPTEDEGVSEIPATTAATNTPAVEQARDALLLAIGREAEHVAREHAGGASAALTQLARAYALVTTGTPSAAGAPALAVASRSAEWDGPMAFENGGFQSALEAGTGQTYDD